MKRFKLVSLAVGTAILFGAFCSCSPDADRQAGQSSAEAAIVREVSFDVPKISCASCLATIRKEVIKEEGVVSIGGDPKAKTVVLRLSAEAPEDSAVYVAAIKRAGFDATIRE